MKRKIFSILFATVLAVSLMLVPAAVSASPGIELNAVGSATAEISTARYHSAANSVRLYVENGETDWAEVSIPVDIALKDITELNFWERIESYYPLDQGWTVNVVLGIDLDDDGVFEADVAGWHVVDSHNAALLGDDTFIEMDGASNDPATGVWNETDALSIAQWWTPNTTGDGLSVDIYCSFADLLTKITASGWDTNVPNTDVRVKCVKLLIGGSPNWMDEIAFVDDATINGVTYDFEPTSSVGLTAAVPDIVAISANPTSIDFGTLYPGQTSSTHDIVVTNVGTHQVKVDADVSGTTGDLFYENLEMKNYTIGSPDWSTRVWNGWPSIITGLNMNLSETLRTKVQVPSSYTPAGPEIAQLIFTATGT